jgi:hypothetical protein
MTNSRINFSKARTVNHRHQRLSPEPERTADNQLEVNMPSDFSFDIGRNDLGPQMRPRARQVPTSGAE